MKACHSIDFPVALNTIRFIKCRTMELESKGKKTSRSESSISTGDSAKRLAMSSASAIINLSDSDGEELSGSYGNPQIEAQAEIDRRTDKQVASICC